MATLEDATAVLRVRVQTWQVAYAHIFPASELDALTAERGAEWWSGVIANPPARTHTLVANDAGEVVGFAMLGSARGSEDSREIGELFAIYVLPEASGRGIGQALMKEVLKRLRDEGFSEAILWVLEDNPRTRRFYALAGWHEDGGSKDEEWLGTLVREVRYRIALVPPR
jgi:ribosomal protein S18 acetylase RimI-like enzyme